MTSAGEASRFRAPLITGFIGSCLLLLGGLIIENLPAGWMGVLASGLQNLGATTWGRYIGQLTFVGGLALTAHAWLRLVLRPAPDALRERAARQAWLWWSLPVLIAPPLFSHDAWSYVAQGALVNAGMDPYTHGPGMMPGEMTTMVDPVWRYTGTPYGPLPLTYGALLAHFVHDPYVAMVAMRLPVVLGGLALIWALPRLARRTHVEPGRTLALGLASPFVIAQGMAGQHNDMAVAGLIAVALTLAARRVNGMMIAASALIGIAAAMKFTAIVAVVPVVLIALPSTISWWRRIAAMAIGSFVASAVVVLAGAPYGLWIGWTKALDVPGKIISPLSPPTAVGLLIEHTWGAHNANVELAAVPVARSIGMALAMAITLVIACTARTAHTRAAMRSGAWIFVAVIACGPAFHTWYILLVIPFVAALATQGWQRKLALALGGFLGYVAPLDSSLKGEDALIVTTVTTAFVLFAIYCIDLWRHESSADARERANGTSQEANA